MYTNIQVPSAQEVFLHSHSSILVLSSFFLTKEQKHKQTRHNNNDGYEVFCFGIKWVEEEIAAAAEKMPYSEQEKESKRM